MKKLNAIAAKTKRICGGIPKKAGKPAAMIVMIEAVSNAPILSSKKICFGLLVSCLSIR